MSMYLCVDCGGTKTSTAIANASGEIIGRSLSGPSNYANLGIDEFIAIIRQAVLDALTSCNHDGVPITTSAQTHELPLPRKAGPFAAAWLGSSVGTPAAVTALTPALSKLLGIPPGPRLTIVEDSQLLTALLWSNPDITHALVVIAGTGSICVGFEKGPGGDVHELGRVGGWGWILGDEGSGYHIGREAVRRVLSERDKVSARAAGTMEGGKRTLEQRVLKHFGAKDPLEILRIVHLPDSLTDMTPIARMPHKKRLSSLCPEVFASAFGDGDPLAMSVLHACARELAAQAGLLLQTQGGHGGRIVAGESVLCFGGSLVVRVPEYREMVLEELAHVGHVFRCVEVVEDPAGLGAKSLAARDLHSIDRETK